jgi:hypothetical protein
MRRLLALAAGFLLGTGCMAYNVTDGPYPIEGTTWFIEKPKPADQGDLRLKMFANRSDCQNGGDVDENDLEGCVPRVDRGVGQVMLSFQILDKKGEPAYLPLTQDQLEVAHLGANRPKETWELVPHGAQRTGQLFIIIIDGSSSIYSTGGIDKVKRALLTPAVIDSFLPTNRTVPSGVMLLRFNEDVKTLDGRDPTTKASIIEKRQQYTDLVNRSIQSNDRGFSHVYDAVTYTATKILEAKDVRNWMEINHASPVIVLLTDGFNNEEARDTCSSNVSRLQSALDTIYRARREGGAFKPTIHTVGLGVAMQPKFHVGPDVLVSESTLCKSYGEDTINGDLELRGIDNPSLAWLADAGGGETFVSNNHKGLAEVFLKAAAQKYKWYTVKYRIDNFYQRRTFDVRLRLKAYAQAESKVVIHPSAWMDAPSGVIPDGENWFVATPLRRSLVPVMSILGLLTFLSFIGPASFNARRALFRRVRRK